MNTHTHTHRFSVGLDPCSTHMGKITVKWSFLYLAIQKSAFFFPHSFFSWCAAQLLAVGRGICELGGIIEQRCLGRAYQLFMRPFCTYGVSCQREPGRWRDNMVLQNTIRLIGPALVFLSTSKENGGFFFFKGHHITKLFMCKVEKV